MITKRINMVLAVLVLATLACQGVGVAPSAIAVPSPVAQAQTVYVSDPASQNSALIPLYEQVSPSVVTILTQGGLGSGFVYDTKGHIVTNYHVVADVKMGAEKELEVDFISGLKVYGKVIGTDLDSDLAVIEVDAPASELHPVTLGDSDQVKVGQTVVAIGNPFGLSSTMTMGIVSALGRTSDSAHTTAEGAVFTAGGLIQTDAAINPGNSGGPLLNLNGEVIGVNREIRSSSQNGIGQPVNSGIGLAISSNIVKRVVPVLIEKGKYDYPYLGISTLPSGTLTLPVIEALGLKNNNGAYVTEIAKGGPADRAGIKAGTEETQIQGLFAGGDLIVAIDGRPIREFDELISYLIANKSPGDTVVLTVLRGDEKLDITVTLDKRP
jgi:2-alkenal reductase